MKTYQLTFIFFMMLTFSEGRAQNISSIRLSWNSVSTMIPSNGTSTNEITQLITSPSDSIKWLGQDGTIKYRLKILETNGTWSDVSQQGSIIYEVDNNGNRGVVYIERASTIKVRMIINTEAEPEVTELTITDIKTL